MNSMKNKVQLIGNVGSDPQVTEFSNGTKKTKISLATTEYYRSQSGEKSTRTNWHNVVAFGSAGEIIIRYLKKGNRVAIEGKLNYHNYEDKEGNRRYITEIVVNEVVILDKLKTAA